MPCSLVLSGSGRVGGWARRRRLDLGGGGAGGVGGRTNRQPSIVVAVTPFHHESSEGHVRMCRGRSKGHTPSPVFNLPPFLATGAALPPRHVAAPPRNIRSARLRSYDFPHGKNIWIWIMVSESKILSVCLAPLFHDTVDHGQMRASCSPRLLPYHQLIIFNRS